jgi:hypothetical protein
MNEATVTCPKCGNEVKLNESLAAPLIAATRQQYEERLSAKDTEVAAREAAVRQKQEDLAKSQESIDEQIETRIAAERAAIATEEAKKARQLLAVDLENKGKELADLQEVLNDREAKLAEAQNAQAEVIRQQRKLDDATREMDLTIEKRVQESLGSVRDKAKLEAEEGLKLKVLEKEELIAGMQRQIEDLKRKASRGLSNCRAKCRSLNWNRFSARSFPAT